MKEDEFEAVIGACTWFLSWKEHIQLENDQAAAETLAIVKNRVKKD